MTLPTMSSIIDTCPKRGESSTICDWHNSDSGVTENRCTSPALSAASTKFPHFVNTMAVGRRGTDLTHNRVLQCSVVTRYK